MQQMVNITQARNGLSDLVSQVAATLNPVVIVRDSKPEAVLVPYSTVLREQELWRQKWEVLLTAGKKAGKTWAKKGKINTEKLSEKELYDLVKQT